MGLTFPSPSSVTALYGHTLFFLTLSFNIFPLCFASFFILLLTFLFSQFLNNISYLLIIQSFLFFSSLLYLPPPYFHVSVNVCLANLCVCARKGVCASLLTESSKTTWIPGGSLAVESCRGASQAWVTKLPSFPCFVCDPCGIIGLSMGRGEDGERRDKREKKETGGG